MAGITYNNSITNGGGTPVIISGLLADRPASLFKGRQYDAIDTNEIYYDTGSAWILFINGKPDTGFVPYTGAIHDLDLVTTGRGIYAQFSEIGHDIGDGDGQYAGIFYNQDPNGRGVLIQAPVPATEDGTAFEIQDNTGSTTKMIAMYADGSAKFLGMVDVSVSVTSEVLKTPLLILTNSAHPGVGSFIDGTLLNASRTLNVPDTNGVLLVDSFLRGTTDQIIVQDAGGGLLFLKTPQDIGTSSNVSFNKATLQLISLPGTTSQYVRGDGSVVAFPDIIVGQGDTIGQTFPQPIMSFTPAGSGIGLFIFDLALFVQSIVGTTLAIRVSFTDPLGAAATTDIIQGITTAGSIPVPNTTIACALGSNILVSVLYTVGATATYNAYFTATRLR